MKTILEFAKMKREKKKISMVTCYDAWMARIADDSNVDCLLVGDSLAMVMHGFDSTLHATVEMMALHMAAVARGSRQKFIVADMPFLSVRKGIPVAMEAVEVLMKAGAHAVKIEGVDGHSDVIKHIIESGVPVMAHLGLTPQSIYQLGGFHVQGKTVEAAEILVHQSLQLEKLGCFALVLECVPAEVSKKITNSLQIPIIGIGAGPAVDGQVLVFQDLLGANPQFTPKFLKTFLNSHGEILGALNSYDLEVKTGLFPTAKETYV